MTGICGATLESLAGEELIPVPRRQPDILARQAGFAGGRRSVRSNYHIRPEEVLLRAVIRLIEIGVVVIHRPHQCQPLGLIKPGHGVEIRDQRMAQLHRVAGDAQDLSVVAPRPPLVDRVLRAMKAEYRAEHTELDPAGV